MGRVMYNLAPQEQEEIRKMRQEYGERITKADVGKIIGISNYESIKEWIKDKRLQVFRPRGRDLYLTEEVVRKIWEDRI